MQCFEMRAYTYLDAKHAGRGCMEGSSGLSAVSALSVSSRWSPFLRLVVLPGLSAVSGLAVSLFSPSRRAGLRHRRYLSLSLVSDSGNTHDQELFSFHRDHSPCDGFEEVLNRYNVFAQLLRLSQVGILVPLFI
ncbi:hypothetical protein Scep_025919 [Stephania cephalantha]|uniref:Uncharacterized protein n=1 Tax=Stephania cephalantha TaxID=152367 RepID=A0AAP0EJ45_9MAGN